MNLFIDTEFNSFGGDLISIALVADDGKEFYQELPLPDVIHPWVREHVVPYMDNQNTPRRLVQQRLEAFLHQFDRVHVIADWPDDLRFFCDLLITGPGDRISLPKVTMELALVDGQSELPHHALHDARGIRDEYNRRYA